MSMKKRILFDASVHLGQFYAQSDSIRWGCKLSQITISEKSEQMHFGIWTDNENGRVDNAIWSLPSTIQNSYYPFMDHFFSIKQIEQIQLERIDVEYATEFMSQKSALSFLSSYTCAVAIRLKATELHTLYTDLLTSDVATCMQHNHQITIVKPFSKIESTYKDSELETNYQRALTTFTNSGTDVFKHLCDPREPDCNA